MSHVRYLQQIYCCSQLFQVCATRSLSHFNATKPADSGMQRNALKFVETNFKKGMGRKTTTLNISISSLRLLFEGIDV